MVNEWISAPTAFLLGTQVPVLLSLGELERALTKAIDSGDTDLVYLAIFRSVPTQLLSC